MQASPRPRAVWAPLALALLAVGLVATVGSVGAGFGLMTSCTDTYSCTTTGRAPCLTAGAWLTWGWAGQGVLLLIGLALAVPTARRVRPRAVRRATLLLAPVSVALLVATTALAQRAS